MVSNLNHKPVFDFTIIFIKMCMISFLIPLVYHSICLSHTPDYDTKADLVLGLFTTSACKCYLHYLFSYYFVPSAVIGDQKCKICICKFMNLFIPSHAPFDVNNFVLMLLSEM